MNEDVERIRQSVNWGGRVKRLNLLVALALVLSLVMPLAAPLAQSTARVQPLLLELAAQQPDQVVSVIVQKAVKDDRVEQAVGALGAKVTKDLHIINAFAAVMKAKDAAQLAKTNGVRWVSLDALMASTGVTNETVRDEFNTVSFDNNNGTVTWSGPWQENDPEAGGAGPSAGQVQIAGGALRLDDSPDTGGVPSAARLVNLTGATGATLSFDYQTTSGVDPDDGVVLEVSKDGGGSYTVLATFTGITGASAGSRTYDLSGFISANTVIRFRISSMYGVSDEFYSADNVQIVYNLAGSSLPPATEPMFITWATASGTVVANGFTNSAAMMDSSLGPNSAYGYGGKVKGALGGFVAEATPGNAISKVEVVLRAYTPIVMSAGNDPNLTIYVGGSAGKKVVLNHHAFDTCVGAVNACTVFVDMTDTRVWQWADFDNNLELLIDQSGFNDKDKLYYDAIGLRVTSVPGSDVTGDSGGDTSALATVDTSKQVNVYNQVIKSSNLWNTGPKLQGKGVTVAVVDSGVYKTKDLSKRVRANSNFNAHYHDGIDRYGHGTFVAGVVAGSGSQSGNKYIGVAPRADVLNVRVSDDQGMSTESDVVSALQWVLDNKGKYNIRVVNLSLNSSVAQSYHTSPLDAACEILWFNGIVVVVAAGNNGTATLFPPANDPFVITVGATDDKATLSTTDDVVAAFSAYGTTESGFAKPDLVAPGTKIIGLLPENDKLSMSAARIANRIDKTYFKMSGTSVSAPMVSGAVALLLQDEPNLTPDQVKYRLKATANKTWPGYSATTSGAGYLDIYAAVVGTTTQSANTGLTASQLLWTGPTPPVWDSVQWGSVQWGSVQWGSVQWGSVQWGSVQWGSDYWGP